MSNKILQCCSKQFKEKASMSNYLPRVLDCRETSTFGQPKLHTGTNCGGLAGKRQVHFFILLPRGHFGTINRSWETRCASSLRAMCPEKLLKGNLSHLGFSTCPIPHHFLPEAPFCFWILLPERQGKCLPASKQVKDSYFLLPFSVSAVCLGYLPSHCPLLTPHWTNTSRQVLPSLVSPCSLLHCYMEPSMGRKEELDES